MNWWWYSQFQVSGMASPPLPVAYEAWTSLAVPDWLNKGDKAWQMIAATLVGIQSMPGLVILYGSIVKKKWAVIICWATWAYNMSFGPKLPPMVWFHCVFAAITVVILAGSVLARMVFVPLWLTFSYTVGAFSLWGGGFLFQWGVMDYSSFFWDCRIYYCLLG